MLFSIFIASKTEYSGEAAPGSATIFFIVGVIRVLVDRLRLLRIYLDDTISLQLAISWIRQALRLIYIVRVMLKIGVAIEVSEVLQTAFDVDEIAIAERLEVPIVRQNNRKHGHGVPRYPE